MPLFVTRSQGGNTMGNVLTQLRPDQVELVHSVVSDLALEGMHTRRELPLLLEAELDWRLHPPETALAASWQW